MHKIIALLVLVFPLHLHAQPPVHFFSDSTIAPLSSSVDVDIKVKDFTSVSGFQGTIRFDTAVLAFNSIKDFAALSAPFAQSDFNTSNSGKGNFSYLWSDPLLAGSTLNDSSVLFTVVFTIKSGAGTVSKVKFDSIPTRLEVSDTSLIIRPAIYDSACIRIINSGTYGFNYGVLKDFEYCAGDSIRFSYNASGSFNSGNQFELQLSDANGSFSSTSVIGSGTKTVDTIRTVIPGTTASGTKYLVRISSTNPRVAGPDNGTYLIIHAKPIVSHAAIIPVCEYDTPFVLKGGAPAFGTYSGPGLIGTGDQFDPSLAGVGSHILTYTFRNRNGCSNSTVVEVRVNAKPPKPSITKVGSDLQSSASVGNQWYINDTLIAGATTQIYAPLRNGLYSVLVTEDGCISDTSNFVLVNVGLQHYEENRFSIYPNPGNGRYRLEVEGEVGQFAIYDARGIQVSADLFELEGQELLVKSSPGIYIIQMRSQNKMFTSRLVHLNSRN